MRRFLIPETIQSSTMDCGPASLKALFEGFGIHVSYGRLREACQTDVDGTSVDMLQETAGRLGLQAVQVMAPPDHVVLPQAHLLPAIVVVRLASGVTHFVVAWSRHGQWIQLMDPAVGRRWIRCDRFIEQMYVHAQPVPSKLWRSWAAKPAFLGALRRRMSDLGMASGQTEELIGEALKDSGTQKMSALDAAVRMADALKRSGGLRRGRDIAVVVRRLADRPENIPERYWSVLLDVADSANRVRMSGAVLIHVVGKKAGQPCDTLSPELSAALQEPPAAPFRELLRAIRAEGLLAPMSISGALFIGAAGIVVEALLFRGLMDLAGSLALSGQRVVALGALFGFVIALLLLEWSAQTSLVRLGRKLENRLRVRFLDKIPRLGDRYFQSRLVSDMAQRCHSVQQLRMLPDVGGRLLRSGFTLLFTVAGLAWLYPHGALLALMAAVAAAGTPLAVQPFLAERDLRLREHTGSLSRFYLDALRGLTAIRAHGGQRSLRRVQEWQLAEWADAGLRLQHTTARAEAIQLTLSYALIAALVMGEVTRGGQPGTILLMIYWALSIPALGQEIAAAAWLYPSMRNITLRFLEPLGAPEEEDQQCDQESSGPESDGVAIDIEDVKAVAGGHTILDGITISVPSGSHVAVVGLSGAGKSSLVGLLLGQYRPVSGRVLIDGAILDAKRLDRLRKETAWIDPQVHLWNQSLLENLLYGADRHSANGVEAAISNAQLSSVLKRLPNGLQTRLGEGGSLVSGGEGQRVRMGRAFSRKQARLVILDEPARGLEFERRSGFLTRAREYWKNATLICITHDVRETLGFDRVLVIDAGRVAEDGLPADLYGKPGSRFRALCDMEHLIREQLWEGSVWRRVYLRDGKLEDEVRREAHASDAG